MRRAGDDLGSSYRRRLTCAVALVVLGVVAASAALVVLFRPSATSGSEQQANAAPAAASLPSPRQPSGSLLSTAPDVTWQLFEGVALPYSETAGPGDVDAERAAGFEQSPTGALLAATHLSVRYVLTPDPGWRRVVEEQVLPGAGRAAFLAARGAYAELDAPVGGLGQVAGFRFVTYSPDAAVVQLATRFRTAGEGAGEVLQVTTNTVRWVDGDWRLELQPDGGTSPSPQRLPNLLGMTAWRGV